MIPVHKPKTQEHNTKIPDFDPLNYPIRDKLKFSFMITFGVLGNGNQKII